MIERKILFSNNRIESIDLLRGLMLIISTIDHLKGPLLKYTWQTFGFVSAAEGFIFLSGLVYGLVYTKYLINKGVKATTVKSFKRAAIIYFYHLIILLVVILPLFLNLWGNPDYSVFKANPVKSIMLYSIFLLQPQNMDILPMYVIFIMIGPFVLKCFYNNKVKRIIIISIGLWLLGQIKAFHYNDFGISGLELGCFNIFCWQLLFFGGSYIGYLRASKNISIPISKGLFGLSILLFIIFLVARYLDNSYLLLKVCSFFSDRSTLGIVRLINFAVITYIINYMTIKTKFINSIWLSLIGRHSLQVFSFSIILINYYYPFINIMKNMDTWITVSINLLLIFLLCIPAYLHQYAAKKVKFIKYLGL